jgi:hypothetical protein
MRGRSSVYNTWFGDYFFAGLIRLIDGRMICANSQGPYLEGSRIFVMLFDGGLVKIIDGYQRFREYFSLDIRLFFR